MKTPDQWYYDCPSGFECGYGDAEANWIKAIQDEAFHEGQLAGLQIGKETAMKTISEVFSKPAE